MLVQMADETRLNGLPIHIVHGALDWMFPVDMAREAERYFSGVGRCGDVSRNRGSQPHLSGRRELASILDWLSPPARREPCLTPQR